MSGVEFALIRLPQTVREVVSVASGPLQTLCDEVSMALAGNGAREFE